MTEERSSQRGPTDPAVKTFAAIARRLSPGDFDEFIELVRHLRQAEDPEEYDSWVRALEELMEQHPARADSFPLADEPMPFGLKRWAEYVGLRIRRLRKAAGMKQANLAAAAGLTQSHIGRLENAEHGATHLTLTKIAKALGVDVGELDPCTA